MSVINETSSHKAESHRQYERKTGTREGKAVGTMGNEDDSTYRSATDIASYVVRRAFVGGHSVNSSQLQLILFFAQELHIGETNRPLFADRIVAREYGPIVSSVFREYVSYGGEPLIPSIVRHDGRNDGHEPTNGKH